MIFSKKANPKVVKMFSLITQARTLELIDRYQEILNAARDEEYATNEYIFLIHVLANQRSMINEILTENVTV